MSSESLESIASPEGKREAKIRDRIYAVFSFLPEDEFFYRDRCYLTRAFMELSHEYPEQFGQLNFGKYGSVVNCEQLDTAISDLDFSRMGETFVGMSRVLMKFDKETLSRYVDQFDHGLSPEVGERFLSLVRYYEESTDGWDFVNSRDMRRAEI